MRTVMLVEDSEMVRRRLGELLSEIGGLELIGSFRTATEAIESLSHTAPDIAILDYALARGNGMEVLREIRQRALPTVVIMFTQYDDDLYRDWFSGGGANYVIAKTRETKTLRDTLFRLAHVR